MNVTFGALSEAWIGDLDRIEGRDSVPGRFAGVLSGASSVSALEVEDYLERAT